MDLLVRHKSAARNVDQTVEAETQDHMDHTFTGIMWNVHAHELPFDYLEITSVWLRGRLGPITIWSTPDGFRGKHEDESAWEKHYDKRHRPSFTQLAEMKLKTPIRLAPGETRGIYAHSASRGDEQIVYDNQRHRVSLCDTHLDILPGLAHLSDVAFSPEGQFAGWWGPPWRERREFVGRLSYGIRWLRWNPDVREQMPPLFREMVWTIIMSRHRRAKNSILYWLTDDHILYILNNIEWWEMPHLQADLDRILHPPKPSVTAKVSAAGAAAGKVVSAKSKSVFKRIASSMASWARRRQGAGASPAAPDPALNAASGGTGSDAAAAAAAAPGTHSARSATSSALVAMGNGVLASAATMASGYGV